ncbi:MAG: ECF transporter S component, partial [Clostridia bacterium]|nr:ECF transporter S component [Clostridia bacterium]
NAASPKKKEKIMENNVTNQDETIVASAINADENTAKKRKIKFFTAGNMAVMAILTAISYILYMFVKFPLPFAFPGWLDMQISDLPALLGGFALGPVAGCIIIVVKCCLKMPFTGTACVGELADIIVGIAFVLPASLLYRKFKNRKSAGLGLIVGSFSAIAFAILANWLVLIPFYSSMFGNGDAAAGLAKIVGMVSALYPKVTTDNFYSYYLPLAVLPFNAIRCIVCALITYFTYKPLSKALHWEIKRKPKKADSSKENTENAISADADSSERVNGDDV